MEKKTIIRKKKKIKIKIRENKANEEEKRKIVTKEPIITCTKNLFISIK